MNFVINWLDKIMDEYKRILVSASSTSRSIIKFDRDKPRERTLYSHKRILAFSDLFSNLNFEQNRILKLWYLKNISRISIAKMLKISRATLYRKHLEIANILYQKQALLLE